MNHREQKDRARAESLEHYRANVADPRNGINHDLHKMRDMDAINNTEEFLGKGMRSNPDASRIDETSYKTRIGESC